MICLTILLGLLLRARRHLQAAQHRHLLAWPGEDEWPTA